MEDEPTNRSVQSLPLQEVTLLQIRLISSKGFEVSLLQNDSTYLILWKTNLLQIGSVYTASRDNLTTDQINLFRGV